MHYSFPSYLLFDRFKRVKTPYLSSSSQLSRDIKKQQDRTLRTI